MQRRIHPIMQYRDNFDQVRSNGSVINHVHLSPDPVARADTGVPGMETTNITRQVGALFRQSTVRISRQLANS
jgi:hypothetical protein